MPPGCLETELAPKGKPQRQQKDANAAAKLLPRLDTEDTGDGRLGCAGPLTAHLHCILVLSSVIEAKRTAGKLLFCVSYTVFRTQAQKSTPSANRLLVGTSGE